jgi:two-component system KDP operon response regulator KdpE
VSGAELSAAAYAAEKQYLGVYMGHLRSKLEPDPARPRFLITEPWGIACGSTKTS